MMRKINEKGRSMVEMMGYMAVMMAVIVAIGKIVTNIFDEYKISQAALQLGDFAAAVSKAGAMEKDYSDVDFKKYVPLSYRVAGDKIFHILGGEVDVAVMNDETDKFAITFKNLRRKQCIELGMKDWRRNQSVDLYAIVVNNNISYWPVYRTIPEASNSLPMTRMMLAGKSDNEPGLCNLETGNIVTWIFN